MVPEQAWSDVVKIFLDGRTQIASHTEEHSYPRVRQN